MNFSFSALIPGFIFGIFGVYFLRQSKKEMHIPKAIIGMTLIIYPYFLENIVLLWLIGVVLVALVFLRFSS